MSRIALGLRESMKLASGLTCPLPMGKESVRLVNVSCQVILLLYCITQEHRAGPLDRCRLREGPNEPGDWEAASTVIYSAAVASGKGSESPLSVFGGFGSRADQISRCPLTAKSLAPQRRANWTDAIAFLFPPQSVLYVLGTVAPRRAAPCFLWARKRTAVGDYDLLLSSVRFEVHFEP